MSREVTSLPQDEHRMLFDGSLRVEAFPYDNEGFPWGVYRAVPGCPTIARFNEREDAERFAGQAFMARFTTEQSKYGVPIPMTLICPYCNAYHVDRDEWATKPHRTHLCADCGRTFRPANVATVGVETLAIDHFDDDDSDKPTEQAKDGASEPRYTYEEAQRAVVRDLLLTALWKASPERSEEGFAIVDGMIARLAENVQGFQDAVNADLERRDEERAVERTWAP